MDNISQININDKIYNIKDAEGRTQVTIMPAASIDLRGRIYQFIGTNGAYTNGYFYKCILNTVTGNYEWVATSVQSGGGGSSVQSDWNQTDSTADDYIKNKPIIPDKVQYEALPVASADLFGKVYQYVGNTTIDYINGWFYKCIEGETTGTYEWINVDVQDSSGGGATVRDEITISVASDFRQAQGSYSFKTLSAVVITLANENTITIPANTQGLLDVGATDDVLNEYVGKIQYIDNNYEKHIYFTSTVFYLPFTGDVQIDDYNTSLATTYSSSKIEDVIDEAKAVEMIGATASQDGQAGLTTKPLAGDNQKALFGDGKYHNIYAANTGSTIYVFTSESEYYGRSVTLTDGNITHTETFSQTGEAVFTSIAMYGNVTLSSTDSQGNVALGSLNLSYFGTYAVGISSNYATLEVTSDDMSLLGIPLSITKNGIVITETSLRLIDGHLKSTVYLNEVGLYKIKGITPSGTAQTTIAVTELKRLYNVSLVVAIVYAFKIDDNNSDPATRVTPYESQYGCENQDYTSAYMDFALGEFNYGSWSALETCNRNELFFAPKPCMLRYDGTVDYYLDPDDYSKKLDGSDSDAADPSYAGNCMIEFPAVYFKRWQESGFSYVIIANKKIDSDFHAYAHHDKNGIVLPYIYVAAFNAVYDGERARSISGFAYHNKKALTVNKIMSNANREREITLTQANNTINEQGEGHYLLHKADLDMINDLITLITLSTNCSTSIGKGRIAGYSSTSNTGIIATGSMNDKGMFWGLNTTSGGAKVFGIEHWYGNMLQSCAGWICNKGPQKIKMTYGEEDGTSTTGFNLTGDGYVTIPNSTPSGTNASGITVYIVSEYGLVPTRASGSSTTYLCDGLSYDNSVVGYARIGGGTNDSEAGGIYFISLSLASTAISWASGVRITYKGIA